MQTAGTSVHNLARLSPVWLGLVRVGCYDSQVDYVGFSFAHFVFVVAGFSVVQLWGFGEMVLD